MSAPLDSAAQDGALDALLGRDLSGVPTAWELALWNGDPRDTHNFELASTGGYARVTGITNNLTNFPAASGGGKTSATFTFPTTTAAWPDPGTHFVLIDASDHTTRWFFGPLTSVIYVPGLGYVVELGVPIYWNQES